MTYSDRRYPVNPPENRVKTELELVQEVQEAVWKNLTHSVLPGELQIVAARMKNKRRPTY